MTKLKKYIKENKVNIATLAKEVGVSYQSIHYWANGDSVPTILNALKLIKVSKGKLKMSDFIA